MKQGHIEINNPSIVAGAGSLKLDDVDISKCVRGFAIPPVKVGDILRVELDVVAMQGMHFTGSEYVGIPAETADLLITLGWTPPDGSNRLINELAHALGVHIQHAEEITFDLCEQEPCATLPSIDRDHLRIDEYGRVVSRHPVGPTPEKSPDTTMLGSQS